MYNEDKYTACPPSSAAENVVPAGGSLVNSFLNRVFSWMFAGLAATGGISWYLGNYWTEKIIEYHSIYWILALLEVLLVVALSAGIRKFSPVVAALLFAVFAIFNGVTLSWLFLRYDISVITKAFCSASLTFGVMGLFGYTTKVNLASVGSLCGMGLIGLVIASVINFFWYNRMADIVISCIGVLIFVGLTAYDVQKLKRLATEMSGSGSSPREVKKYAILGALELYLDFINTFLFMVHLFNGGRR